MGTYQSDTWDGFTITPPLRWEQFRHSPFYFQGDEDESPRDLMLVEKTEQQHTADGLLQRITAVGIAASSDYAFDASRVIEQLQEIVDLAGPGHTVTRSPARCCSGAKTSTTCGN